MKKNNIVIWKFSFKMILAILFYTIFIFLMGLIFHFSLNVEFFIAIFLVFFYFLFAVWILKISFNKSEKKFYRIYFGGVVVRIISTLIIFWVLIQAGFSFIRILLFMVPLYFLMLMLEAIEMHKLAK